MEQLQLKDRMRLYRYSAVYSTHKACIFSVPCELDPAYGVGCVITLEDHAFFGDKGQRFYIEEGYRLSLEEVKKDAIKSALRQLNTYLESVAKARKQFLETKDITQVTTEAEGKALAGMQD